jgi:LacI family transcriptional regulator
MVARSVAVRRVTSASYRGAPVALSESARILHAWAAYESAYSAPRMTVGSGGSRPPTIYEVARRAGVSIATVSRVQRGRQPVADETRTRVETAIRELAYRPSAVARSLARGRRHEAIGIVFPDLSGPYYSAVILGYEQASAVDGRSVLILGTHRRSNLDEQVRALADRIDGIVLLGQTVGDGLVGELIGRGLPCVVLARPAPAGADSIRTENLETARRLVAHVIGHGHRRIAFLGDPSASPDAAERWEGFRQAHRDAGLAIPEAAVRSGFREPDGRNAARRLLLGAARPTAIAAANDELALGAMDAARAAGLHVPGDLAITGWDDIPVVRHLSPPLTTVRQPMEELGRRAAEFLHERLTGSRIVPRHEVLPTELVVRSSCGCPSTRSEGERR